MDGVNGNDGKIMVMTTAGQEVAVDVPGSGVNHHVFDVAWQTLNACPSWFDPQISEAFDEGWMAFYVPGRSARVQLDALPGDQLVGHASVDGSPVADALLVDDQSVSALFQDVFDRLMEE